MDKRVEPRPVGPLTSLSCQAESQQMSLETLRAQNRLIEEPGGPAENPESPERRAPLESPWPWLSKHPLKKGFKKEEIRALIDSFFFRKTSDAGQK